MEHERHVTGSRTRSRPCHPRGGGNVLERRRIRRHWVAFNWLIWLAMDLEGVFDLEGLLLRLEVVAEEAQFCITPAE